MSKKEFSNMVHLQIKEYREAFEYIIYIGDHEKNTISLYMQQGTIFEKFTGIRCFVYTNFNIPYILQSKQSKYKLYIEMYKVNTEGFR